MHDDAASGSPSPPLSSEELGKLDQIRDILFGAQSRDIDRRFALIEERLVKAVSDARDEHRRQLEALETATRQGFAALEERLQREQAEREQAIHQIMHGLEEATLSHEQRLARGEERTAQGQRELQEQISERTRSLEAGIRGTFDAFSSTLTRAIEELRHDKADRAAVATLLCEMAAKLSSGAIPPSRE